MHCILGTSMISNRLLQFQRWWSTNYYSMMSINYGLFSKWIKISIWRVRESLVWSQFAHTSTVLALNVANSFIFSRNVKFIQMKRMLSLLNSFIIEKPTTASELLNDNLNSFINVQTNVQLFWLCHHKTDFMD